MQPCVSNALKAPEKKIFIVHILFAYTAEALADNVTDCITET